MGLPLHLGNIFVTPKDKIKLLTEIADYLVQVFYTPFSKGIQVSIVDQESELFNMVEQHCDTLILSYLSERDTQNLRDLQFKLGLVSPVIDNSNNQHSPQSSPDGCAYPCIDLSNPLLTDAGEPYFVWRLHPSRLNALNNLLKQEKWHTLKKHDLESRVLGEIVDTSNNAILPHLLILDNPARSLRGKGDTVLTIYYGHDPFMDLLCRGSYESQVGLLFSKGGKIVCSDEEGIVSMMRESTHNEATGSKFERAQQFIRTLTRSIDIPPQQLFSYFVNSNLGDQYLARIKEFVGKLELVSGTHLLNS